jgi:hypothetical protein
MYSGNNAVKTGYKQAWCNSVAWPSVAKGMIGLELRSVIAATLLVKVGDRGFHPCS